MCKLSKKSGINSQKIRTERKNGIRNKKIQKRHNNSKLLKHRSGNAINIISNLKTDISLGYTNKVQDAFGWLTLFSAKAIATLEETNEYQQLIEPKKKPWKNKIFNTAQQVRKGEYINSYGNPSYTTLPGIVEQFNNYQRTNYHGFCQTFSLIEYLRNNLDIYNDFFQEPARQLQVPLPEFISSENEHKNNNIKISIFLRDFFKKRIVSFRKKTKLAKKYNNIRDDIVTKSMWAVFSFKEGGEIGSFNDCANWLVDQAEIFIKSQKEENEDIILQPRSK